MKNTNLVLSSLATSAVIGAMLPMGAASAATDTPSGEPVTFKLNIDVADAASSSSSFDYKSSSIVKSATNDQGQTVLTPVNKPTAHWKMRFAKKFPTLKSYPTKRQIKKLEPTVFIIKKVQLPDFKKAAMSERVVKKLPHNRVKVEATGFWLGDGEGFPDTGLDLDGNVQGMGNRVHGENMLFEIAKLKARKSGESGEAQVPVRRGQDNDGDGVIDDGDCGNVKPAVVTFPEGTYDYDASGKFWWKDTGSVLARVGVKGSATISQGNCAMTLNYDFLAQGDANYSVVVKGMNEVEAHGETIKVVSKQAAHADAAANAAAFIKANLEAQFKGCDTPPPADNLPSMQCHAAQHIWVGEDPMVAVFDLTDPDGTPVSFDKLEVSGPIEVVLTEDTTISGGKRRTLTIRAGWVPEGTEQAYSLKLFGSSGGKQTSCLAEGTVKNNDTGWKTFQLWSKELDAGYAR